MIFIIKIVIVLKWHPTDPTHCSSTLRQINKSILILRTAFNNSWYADTLKILIKTRSYLATKKWHLWKFSVKFDNFSTQRIPQKSLNKFTQKCSAIESKYQKNIKKCQKIKRNPYQSFLYCNELILNMYQDKKLVFCRLANLWCRLNTNVLILPGKTQKNEHRKSISIFAVFQVFQVCFFTIF